MLPDFLFSGIFDREWDIEGGPLLIILLRGMISWQKEEPTWIWYLKK